MNKLKRTTTNIPEDLLESAIKASGRSITETIILGLEMVKRSAAFEKAQKLKGKLNLNIDTDLSRERSNR